MSIVCVSLEWTRKVPAKLLFFSPVHGMMTKDSHLLLMSQTMVCAIRDLIYDYRVFKHFMTEPMGNSEFCFPEILRGLQGKGVWNVKSQGETKLAVFLWGQSFKIVLLYLPTQEQNKLWKLVIGLIRCWLKHKLVVCTVSRCTTWLHASWKLKLLFPYGVSEFCLPHKKFSFKLNVKMYLSWAVHV